MSVGPIFGPVQRPGEDRDFAEIFERLDDIDRRPSGRWVYAGTYPTDPLTTPDSPAFQNGITGRLRFRRTTEHDLQIEADISGMSPGDVVVNISAFYLPPTEGHGVGAQDDTDVSVWKLTTAGDLIYLGAVAGAPADGLTWGTNNDTNSDGLELLAHGAVSIDTDGSTFKVLGDGNAELDVNQFTVIALDNVEFDLASGRRFSIRDSTNFRFLNIFNNNSYELYLGSSETFVVRDSGGNVILRLIEDGTFEFTPADDFIVNVPSGKKFTVNDSSANPMLQMTEGSPDLHIPTGGNVVADL